MEQLVFTCKHIPATVTPIPGQHVTNVMCDRCYQAKHARRNSKAYYVTRAIVRGIFWTALVATISGLSILGIWVLWAVL